MHTTEKTRGKPQRMMCCNCGVLVFKNEEYCDQCGPLRSVIATAAIEKSQAITAAAHAEERIKLAVDKLEKIKSDQQRVYGLKASRH